MRTSAPGPAFEPRRPGCAQGPPGDVLPACRERRGGSLGFSQRGRPQECPDHGLAVVWSAR